ncbi:MAG: very short patch repair endonuclease [Bacteroidales bacterium]|jgi:DNA mismatch endonuclease (patch repair protein)|nr:very short patch repair endonuclease [Bacteroidales bacterium]
MDTVTKEKRSEMMSGIRSRNTKPELLIRKGLFKLGYRYRINSKIYGKPDIVLKKYNAVIFIHGCFWHGHIGCENFKIPKSNTQFWVEKIEKNRDRDAGVLNYLRASGWRICIIWECAIRGKTQMKNFDKIINRISKWLISKRIWIEITSDTYNKQ